MSVCTDICIRTRICIYLSVCINVLLIKLYLERSELLCRVKYLVIYLYS